jgi:hypothetical protein
MLRFLDFLLSCIHLSIVFFNLFGWIPKRWRKAHFISVVLTASSWFILGIWFGFGYCPFTDWQWQVKERLGETGLPSNFVEYFAEKISGHDFSPVLVSNVIAYSFAAAAGISIYVNFIVPVLHRKAGVLKQ